MEYPNRKALRLKGFDYSSPNHYFVTICTQNRRHILSRISVGDGFPVPQLTHIGSICDHYIRQIPVRFPSMHIDKYVIMPNHVHMIIVIDANNGTGNPSPTVGDAIAWFKYLSTKHINDHSGTSGNRIFQRSFHDHIIRGETDHLAIWQYIDTNPQTWETDCFYNEGKEITHDTFL